MSVKIYSIKKNFTNSIGVHCTMYNVQCTMYNIQDIFLNLEISGEPHFQCKCNLGWTGPACDIDCGCSFHSTCSQGVGVCDQCLNYTSGDKRLQVVPQEMA